MSSVSHHSYNQQDPIITEDIKTSKIKYAHTCSEVLTDHIGNHDSLSIASKGVLKEACQFGVSIRDMGTLSINLSQILVISHIQVAAARL